MSALDMPLRSPRVLTRSNLSQMGVSHDVLVRVELPHAETTLPMVNMGKRSLTDVQISSQLNRD